MTPDYADLTTTECALSRKWSYPDSGKDENSCVARNCEVLTEFTEYLVTAAKKVYPKEWKNILDMSYVTGIIFDYADNILNRDVTRHGFEYDAAIEKTLNRLKNG